MEAFQYQALNAAGRTVSGVVQADTARQARAQLRAQGLFPSQLGPVRAKERAGQAWSRGISAAELSLTTRQMATLLASGLTMEQSLNALIEAATDPVTREVLTGVKTEVTAGLSLAGALGAYEKSLPLSYTLHDATKVYLGTAKPFRADGKDMLRVTTNEGTFEIPLTEAARRLSGATDTRELRDALGGRIHDEAVAESLHSLGRLAEELAASERHASVTKRET